VDSVDHRQTTALVIRSGACSVAISRVEPAARYLSDDAVSSSRPAGHRVDAAARVARVLVELRVNFGGMVMRAMLGGEFRPDEGPEVTFEVLFDSSFDEATTEVGRCASALGGPMVSGLTGGYARAAREGLAASAAPGEWPAGVVRVDRAAVHYTDSSIVAFRRAGGLLGRVLLADVRGEDHSRAAHAAMASWDSG
jgi:hypothetical protein